MSAGGLRHRGGLDGLRAVAVVAVIVFHGQVGALRGGYLGVDLFFVLSGYLITTLLIGEAGRDGRIDLPQFWARRFRRLLPAVLLMLLGVAVFAATLAESERLTEIRWDTLASLAYVANWRFIASGHSYFDTISAPSPVQHLWSLAVEEQWYLLWPFVCAVALAARRGRRAGDRRILAVVVVAGTAASATTMSLLASRPGDPSRAYYGTDARAQMLLIGAGLALLLRDVSLGHTEASPRARAGLMVAWCAAALAVVAAFVWADESRRWMYHGGFTAFAGLCAVLIAGVICVAPIDRVLGLAPLRWIGARSYGLYLWHWPIGLALSASRTGVHGWARFAMSSAATVVVAELSYRLVEQPIRHQSWKVPHPRIAVPSVMAVVAVVLVLSTTGATAVPVYARHDTTQGPPVVMEPTDTQPEPVPESTSSAPTATTPTATTPNGPAPTTTAHRARRTRRVLLLGDSVAVSLQDQLGRDLVAAKVAFTSFAFPGCGVVTGTPVDVNGTTLVNCPVIAETQNTAVRQSRADLVVLSSTWESSHRKVGATVYRTGTAEWRRELATLYDETIARATRNGARVALVLQPDITDGASTSVDPRVNTDLHLLNDVLRAVAASHPGVVTLVDIGPVVCPSTPCPDTVNGVAYRPKDGRHFEMPGAKPVAAALTQRLTALDLDSL